MSMKKILMTAVAVSALSAGAASAAVLSLGNSTVGAVSLLATDTVSAEPLTIANEVNAPADTAAVLQFVPNTGVTIAAGTYLVTWTISGGTFDTTSIAFNGGAVTNLGTISGTPTATSISAVFVSSVAPTSFQLTVPVVLGTAKTPVSVAGSITTPGLVPVDGGAIASTTIVDYRTGIKSAATAVAQKLAVTGGFKKFLTTGSTSGVENSVAKAVIGQAVSLIPNSGTQVTDKTYYYSSGVPAILDQTAIGTLTTAATVTVGGALSAFKAIISETATVGATLTDATFSGTTLQYQTTATGVVLNAGNLAVVEAAAGVQIGLQQASAVTSVAGTESPYTVTISPTLASGHTAQSYTTRALGTVSYEGSTILAPWVGDGSNGITYTIRLGNKTAAAVSSVTAILLNPYTTGTSGSVASTAACSLGSIPLSGELLVTSSTLTACFGAFKRSDVALNVTTLNTAGDAAGAAATITAKMRASAGGVVSDVTLGGGALAAVAN